MRLPHGRICRGCRRQHTWTTDPAPVSARLNKTPSKSPGRCDKPSIVRRPVKIPTLSHKILEHIRSGNNCQPIDSKETIILAHKPRRKDPHCLTRCGHTPVHRGPGPTSRNESATQKEHWVCCIGPGVSGLSSRTVLCEGCPAATFTFNAVSSRAMQWKTILHSGVLSLRN